MIVFGALEIRTAREARKQADELLALRSAAPANPPVISRHTAAPHASTLAEELIALADRLADLTGSSSEEATAATHGVRSRVEAVLTLCGIAPIADDGPIDFLRHEVVGERPAPRPGLVDHIAATVRPGYRLHGELLRPQQVIAYTDPAD